MSIDEGEPTPLCPIPIPFKAFLVHADTKRAQLEEVLAAFGLGVEEEALLTRCARCNGQFRPEPLPAAALPADHDVPPGILEKHLEFWVCARCDAVFWQVSYGAGWATGRPGPGVGL